MEWLKIAVDYGIIGLLIVMSIIAFGIAIERSIVYKNIRLAGFINGKTLELELTKKLHLIATIGTNAPYIGLLGTVLGIMFTFYSMGTSGVLDSEKIMLGLALALKATAVGLLVAIPSIVLYNLLLRKVKVLLGEWEINNAREGI